MANSENSKISNLHSDLSGTCQTVPALSPGEVHTPKNILVNVGGEKHAVPLKLLNKFPNSRLGKLSKFPAEVCLQQGICDDYSEKTNEYFFSRHPKTFNAILSFYYTGKLHMPDGMCVIAFAEDMHYWEIEELHLDACCKFRYYELLEQVEDELREIEDINFTEEETFGNGMRGNCKKYIWELFEHPNNSCCGRILAFISIVLIVVSTIIVGPNTVPEFDDLEYIYDNDTISYFDEETGQRGEDSVAGKHYTFLMAEEICVFWFTLEYLTRLFVAPEKWKFLKDKFNIFDLLAILPYYVTHIIYMVSTTVEQYSYLLTLVDIFRLIITLRVFKLARHNTGLQSFLFTLSNSYKELGILFLLLIMGVLTFSTLAYYAEKDENQAFDTIPTTFWWAAITMSAIGVGDMITITAVGKLISFVCGVSGILFIGLPIPIIVDSFTAYYNDQERRLKVVKRCKSLKKEDPPENCSRSILTDGLKGHSYCVGNVSTSLCQPDPEFSRKWELAKLSGRPLLNVGGFSFEVTWNTLQFVPNARLSQLSSVTNSNGFLKLCDDYSLEDFSKFYFHRDHRPFSSIIGLYLTGKFHLLEDLCPVAFETEMEYWMINEAKLENCCVNRYRKRKDEVCKEREEIECLLHQVVNEENFGNGLIAKCRKYVWSVLEKPSRTILGKFYGLISVTITILSAFILMLKSVPVLKTVDGNGVLKDNYTTLNDVETFCIVWIGCEYTLRFLISPNKCTFLTEKLNSLDPFIVIFYSLSGYFLHGKVDADSALVLRHFCDILRILRLFRIFKLATYSTALEALAFTLKSSIEQMGVLLLFLAVGVLIFSSLAYVAEKGNPQFVSITGTFWWALTTMRTVAVGDIHTITVKGKMISFVCGLFGLLFLLLPIPIIASNFNTFYKRKMRRDRSQRGGRKNMTADQSLI